MFGKRDKKLLFFSLYFIWMSNGDCTCKRRYLFSSTNLAISSIHISGKYDCTPEEIENEIISLGIEEFGLMEMYSRKELSLCHKLWFSNPFIFVTQCHRPYIFKTLNSVESNSVG